MMRACPQEDLASDKMNSMIQDVEGFPPGQQRVTPGGHQMENSTGDDLNDSKEKIKAGI